MYKININGSELFLIHPKDLPFFSDLGKDSLIIKYHNKKSILLNYIDSLEKSRHQKTIVVSFDDYNKLKSDFKSLYKIVKASGGVVVNEFDEILFIYRRGFWDLPKGKIERHEGKREAGLREVEEETGVTGLTIVDKLPKTIHTFTNKKGIRVLKICYWYLMSTIKQELVPQTEEDIEEALWLTKESFLKSDKTIYSSLLPLVQRLELI